MDKSLEKNRFEIIRMFFFSLHELVRLQEDFRFSFVILLQCHELLSRAYSQVKRYQLQQNTTFQSKMLELYQFFWSMPNDCTLTTENRWEKRVFRHENQRIHSDLRNELWISGMTAQSLHLIWTKNEKWRNFQTIFHWFTSSLTNPTVNNVNWNENCTNWIDKNRFGINFVSIRKRTWRKTRSIHRLRKDLSYRLNRNLKRQCSKKHRFDDRKITPTSLEFSLGNTKEKESI